MNPKTRRTKRAFRQLFEEDDKEQDAWLERTRKQIARRRKTSYTEGLRFGLDYCLDNNIIPDPVLASNVRPIDAKKIVSAIRKQIQSTVDAKDDDKANPMLISERGFGYRKAKAILDVHPIKKFLYLVLESSLQGKRLRFKTRGQFFWLTKHETRMFNTKAFLTPTKIEELVAFDKRTPHPKIITDADLERDMKSKFCQVIKVSQSLRLRFKKLQKEKS